MNRWLIPGVALALVLIANLVFWPSWSPGIKRGPRNAADLQNLLARRQPAVVLLGNSYLQAAVDVDAFASQTNVNAVTVAVPGGYSAWWYVVMKNVILEATPLPRMVVLFFLDTSLTEPENGVDPPQKELIDRYAYADEPVLDRLAYYQAPNPFRYLLLRYSPLYHQREDIRDSALLTVRRMALFGQKPLQEIDAAVDRLFRDEHMNRDLLTKRQIADEAQNTRSDFPTAVTRSFLPHLIRMAKDHHVRLVLVRMKAKRYVGSGQEPKPLQDYLRDLRAYLSAKSIPLLDCSDFAGLTPEHYADGGHLNAQGKGVFTPRLAEAMKPLFAELHEESKKGPR